jgi:hypothetical protein
VWNLWEKSSKMCGFLGHGFLCCVFVGALLGINTLLPSSHTLHKQFSNDTNGMSSAGPLSRLVHARAVEPEGSHEQAFRLSPGVLSVVIDLSGRGSTTLEANGSHRRSLGPKDVPMLVCWQGVQSDALNQQESAAGQVRSGCRMVSQQHVIRRNAVVMAGTNGQV